MYTRSKDSRIPPNYGGSIFGRRDPSFHFTPDGKPPVPSPNVDAPSSDIPPEEKQGYETQREASNDEQNVSAVSVTGKPHGSILSPLGALGSEELLLIAIALIIFQSDKQPDLALILLALLFIN